MKQNELEREAKRHWYNYGIHVYELSPQEIIRYEMAEKTQNALMYFAMEILNNSLSSPEVKINAKRKKTGKRSKRLSK
jgi:hypothetical protein